ncbi:MAG: NUDIX hydrolase [Hyphomicrobiales bacterium]|nr:NUDIX domain-containing protein [Hyphomicrobiales bacterium]PCH51645.1 MAG: NUDIX hydrolase [Hyphomicrobiales bacterium]
MSKVPLRAHLLHFIFRFTRPMTMGVRIVVLNDVQEILLVRHTYIDGWYLPGGGVEIGHTAAHTAGKELFEETGITCLCEPKLFAVYANKKVTKRDHVLLYKVEKWEQTKAFAANWEIKEAGFFALDALPANTTQSTKDRLAEMLDGKEISQIW